MSNHDLHHDWLALIEISGPFLAVPVLKEAFPQGLEELDGTKRKRLRQAYEEWREALETDDTQFDELHAAWIDEVLARGLELDEDGKGDVLKRADWCAANLNFTLPEHGVTLSPDLAVIDEQRANKPLMLIHTYGQDVDLDATLKLDGWAATPADRMVQLCRAAGCRLGLVTNGERWMLVDAPVGAVTTFASWYARIWSQEPITLQAFVHLLGIRRFFVDEAEQLPALFDRSMKYQDEVTDALGEQVRRAVEVLIQALDKADQDRDRELLRDVKEPVLYEAALTVMMRLVFLLSAEERGLLLLGDERYEANYALSTLRMLLRKESEEILERRWDAWSRLLAIFRAVFGGIEHENLRLPALGGSLFDPDRFPFLEGRAKGSDWRTDIAKPLPIDNRTVLLLLEAIQQFQGRTLSYRALDVEQIGYVYEGLLERTVKRTAEVTLELDGTKNAKAPWVKLAELESARLDGAERLAELLQERSGSSASRVRNDLAKPVDDTLADRLLAACHGDTNLRNRIKPIAHLIRTDPWGYPLVYPAGAFIVTTGSDRRETGTHYTPKSLTEAIVTETLTPIAYVGPAEGKPRDQWVLKPPAELFDLKICDPAMGSGAFLVQACRWLAERLVEAWSEAEAAGKTVSVDGEVLLGLADAKEPLPREAESRIVIARRLIAERCLYGVDLNPLAVELAKLSIWLVTLAKGRPFGFLDHNLRCGDSLLGIHRLDQLTELTMTPGCKGQQRLFGRNIEQAVQEAIELRQRLREMPIRDIHDVEAMARLDADARRKLEVPERIADALIGEVFAAGAIGVALENAIGSLAIQAGQAVGGDLDAVISIVHRAKTSLTSDAQIGKTELHPFHWPLEFPEVFQDERGGFAAIIGNPPFLGGKKISTSLGSKFFNWLKNGISGTRGAADISAYFFIRAESILRERGTFGLIATNTICQGDTREVGLARITQLGSIYRARPTCPWPGAAGVDVAVVHYFKGAWRSSCTLNNSLVKTINSRLESGEVELEAEPRKLINSIYGTKGTYVHGEGFIIDSETRSQFILANKKNSEVLQRYLVARDFTTQTDQHPTRWVINFRDLPEEIAATYTEPFAHLVKLVKPTREKITRQIHEACFWKHWDRRDDLYQHIARKSKVIVCPEVGKHCCFSFLPSDLLFSHMVNVIPSDSFGVFSLLQSNVHVEWAWRYGSTMRNAGIRYTTSDCLKTFPVPEKVFALDEIGVEYFSARDAVMKAMGKGLTSFYNRLNDVNDTEPDIENMRRLQVNMDCKVLAAYEWDDITPNHNFFDAKQGIRFSFSIAARDEVLKRLLQLNHIQYEKEVAQGLHGGSTETRASRVERPHAEEPIQHGMDFGVETNTRPVSNSVDASVVIRDHLRSLSGWQAKNDILAATGIQDGQWNAAINDLIDRGEVERQGEKRGARYRAITRRQIV